MKKLTKISCMLLLLLGLSVQQTYASAGDVWQGEVKDASLLTGRGNQDEPLLSLSVDIPEGTTGRWKKLKLALEGSFTKADVTRIKIYVTPASTTFDPRRVGEYMKLGECSAKNGTLQCALSGALTGGKHRLWVACDVSDKAVEGHRIEASILSVSTSAGTIQPIAPAVKPTCEILLTRKLLYAPGDYQSRNYRIPAIVTAPDGSLVIATDKRKANQTDLPEDIDILVNRSTDGGQTWSEPLTIAQGLGRFKGYGDAALVRTDDKGGLLCIFVGGTGFFQSTLDVPQRTYVCKSADNGLTWTRPRDITDQLFGKACSDSLRGKWTGSFCASGAGLLSRDGTIWFVAAVRETSKRSIHDIANYVYYSEDKGETWKVSSCVKADDANEAKIVELNDGSLLVSIRNQQKGPRFYSISKDRGQTWSPVKTWNEMVEPGCNGDIIRYTSVKDGQDKDRLLHSVPNDPKRRRNVSVFLSYDEAKTWPIKKTICAGGSAYSSLCILPDGTIGLYTEENEDTEDFSMYFTRFSLEWLTDGADKL
ncbi:MAG: sialidase family protein [Bacteroides sp.]|nr:sialidase family protein [Bacteroides sp.]